MRSRQTIRYSIWIGIFSLALAPWTSPESPVAAEALAGTERPPITGIAHVAFRTSDMKAARHFYHEILGFDDVLNLKASKTGSSVSFFKVNDHQYIEVSPTLQSPSEDRLIDIAFETADARELSEYLRASGVRGVSEAARTRVGDVGFKVKDPQGHVLEFVQYLPGSELGRRFGQGLSSRRISTEIIHVGLTVRSRTAEDHFYKDLLGFRLMWYGGMTDNVTDWVSLHVPNGENWLEYMLRVRDPSPRQLGVMHHFSLGVPSCAKAYDVVVGRGAHPHKPQIGRDGKWQLNLFDPDGTRVELMEPRPVRTPCCSPMLP